MKSLYVRHIKRLSDITIYFEAMLRLAVWDFLRYDFVARESDCCAEFHSEFAPLEVTRHTPLTDRQTLHYFELPKLPEAVTADDELKLWLTLFNAETEEDLAKIEEMEVSVMKEAIGAYRQVTATDEFRELERLRSYARHNEASALGHARREGYREAEEKWQGVVADKDAQIAEQISENENLRRQLAKLQSNQEG